MIRNGPAGRADNETAGGRSFRSSHVVGRQDRRYSVSSDQHDGSLVLLQAQGSKAKVIGFANAGADLLNPIKAAKDFNITSGQTIVPLVGTITEVNALGAAPTQGMLLVEPFCWASTICPASG